MEYTLMHKNIPITDMIIDETGYIAKIQNTHDVTHLPPGISIFKTGIDRKGLNDWWIGRSIPASRDGINDALQSIGISSPTLLIEKCYGLSLSDQYWICPKDSGLKWESINFFHNNFSKDISEILFGHEPADPTRVNLVSPDNTSDGRLRKKWIIADGKRFLMKGGSGVYQQEPFNEVAASTIMQRLNIHHVDYSLIIENNKPYSLCENFITPDTELIPAWHILQSFKQPNDRSLYKHFIDCCEMLGVPDIKSALDKLLTLDYIIANEDRHWNNFALLRNADTLKWLGLAPVFDSGTSLWYNTMHIGSPITCKPFHKDHSEQIQLVNDLSWYDVNTLDGLENIIMEIFSVSEEVDERRRTDIAKEIMDRANQVEQLRKTLAEA